jgi:choline dehydrogenase-like flavoprotein
MNYVIGSGPAGVAAAAALLARGQPVTMLDAGGELESEIQADVERLAAEPHERWTSADLERLKGARLRYNSEGAPLKLAFSSDFPYRDVDELQPVDVVGVDAYRAFAAGGLSVLWGASILPFSETDLEGWPIGLAEMRRHYASAVALTGIAGADDALASVYPLYATPSELPVSEQARFVMGQAAAHAGALERQRILVGRARLAVSQPSPAGHACIACGMCLYGCPFGLIYSARSTLRTLTANNAFTYVPDVIVRRVAEQRGRISIEAIARVTRQPKMFEATRVYLAAGAFGSTAILLASMPAPASVLLRQSDHFLLPLLLRGFRGHPAAERLHTLSQVFVEILAGAVSTHGVHLQLYTYSDFYQRMAHDRLGWLYPLAAPLIVRLIERAAVMKGYLHSDDSAAIRVTLVARPNGPSLRAEAVPSPRSRAIVDAVTTLITRNGAALGVSPVRLGRRIGLPGSGVHVGGSFPMRQQPREFESDRLGRPTGFERLHVVDATTFPTLPAAPPTLTIMANAIRIASETPVDGPA